MKNWYAITGINSKLQMHWLYEVNAGYKVEYNEKGQRYALIALTAVDAFKLRMKLRKLGKQFGCKLKLTRMSAM